MWYALSTNFKVHKVVAGFYKCNRAIGKIPEHRQIFEEQIKESQKCKICFQYEN